MPYTYYPVKFLVLQATSAILLEGNLCTVLLNSFSLPQRNLSRYLDASASQHC
eukprot:c30143_g1_i1 orf=3-158(-)